MLFWQNGGYIVNFWYDLYLPGRTAIKHLTKVGELWYTTSRQFGIYRGLDYRLPVRWDSSLLLRKNASENLESMTKGIPRISPWWGGFPGVLFCYSVNSTIRWKMQGWGRTTIVRWWQTVEQFSWTGRVIMPLGGDWKNKCQVEKFLEWRTNRV